MTVRIPEGASYPVLTTKEAIRVLCLLRPLEFRLVERPRETITHIDRQESVTTTMLLLEASGGQNWAGCDTWLHPATWSVAEMDDWALCRPVACFVLEEGLSYMSGFDQTQVAGTQDWWMVHQPGQRPIVRRGLHQSEAAIMAYAELVRLQGPR